ncbi:S-layer homology domain-containing protein [Paenibacillus sp. GYB004]|uniref:S-layer homology domain-containing protein n=1 Tax=Paenibacillus sp. GYB004 TaxID=2994393 RepID=UPI002F96C110
MRTHSYFERSVKRKCSVLLVICYLLSVFTVPLWSTAVYADGSTGGSSNGASLDFQDEITGWLPSEDGKYIYAISKPNNQFYSIDTTVLSVVYSFDIGLAPSDISYDNGKVYVALEGSNKIAAVDTNAGTVTGAVYEYNLSHSPAALETVNGKIYYASPDTPELRVVDMVTAHDEAFAISGWTGPAVDLALDKTGKTLYLGTSRDITKVDLERSETTATGTWNLGSSNSKLIIDDLLVYFGQLKFAESDLLLYGGFDSNVIHANSEHVFTNNLIYNTFSGKIAAVLPSRAGQVCIIQGSVFIYYTDEQKLIKYTSVDLLLQEVVADQVPQHPVPNLKFYDVDSREGFISGSVSWVFPEDIYYVTNYVIYYTDDQGVKIGKALAELDKYTAMYNIINRTVIPDGATRIAVYTKNALGESAVAASVPINDSALSSQLYIMGISLTDTNPMRGKTDFVLSWHENEPNPAHSVMELYPADIHGIVIGNKIADVPLNKSMEVQKYSLGELPEGAALLQIKYKRKNGTYDEDVSWGKPRYLLVADNILSENVSDQIGGSGTPERIPLNGPITFVDEDLDSSEIGGRLQWFELWVNSNASKYVVYFVNGNDERIKPILEVNRIYPGGLTDFTASINYDTPVPDGAIKLGIFAKNDQGESATGEVKPLWDSPFAKADRIWFTDTNPTGGLISPKLSWVPSYDETSIAGYEVLFLDMNMEKIESTKKFYKSKENKYFYEMAIPYGDIPPSTRYMTIVSVNLFEEQSWIDMNGNFMAPISDNNSADSIRSNDTNRNITTPYVTFLDLDGDLGEIGGRLYVSPGTNNNSHNAYFLDESYNKIQSIVTAKSFGQYYMPVAHIPMNTRIPANAKYIGVYTWDGTHESEPYTMPITGTDRTYSAMLTDSQITVINNPQGTEDTITITGLVPGNEIKVYRDRTVPYPIASVIAFQNAVTIPVKQLGVTEGSIFFTVSNQLYVESDRLEKTYAAEPVNPIRTPALTADQISVVNNRVGTDDKVTVTQVVYGDVVKVYRDATISEPLVSQSAVGTSAELSITQLGTGTGSVFVTVTRAGHLESLRTEKAYAAEQSGSGPGGGGPGGPMGSPSSADNSKVDKGSYTPQTKTETFGGKAYTVAELDGAKLAEVFKQAQSSNSNKAVIDLKESADAKVIVPVEALANAANGSENAVLSIAYKNVSYDLPVQLFDVQALAKQLGVDPKDVRLTITVENVGEPLATDLETKAKQAGLTLLTPPVEFSIAISTKDGSKQQTIDDFGSTFVSRTFTLGQPVNGSEATAVRIDPVTNELHFVPAVFTVANGQTEVRMMRQGNSLYSVVQTPKMTFADLEGHWAQADIELLASKLIVKGAAADQYIPDQQITRAEFAALLVRSLGIAQPLRGETTFEDVQRSDWFSGAVTAAVDKGLVTGVENNRFAPNEPVTREQMALMISRALKMTGQPEGVSANTDPLSAFADREAVSIWAQAAVTDVLRAGLMNGVGEDTFAPADSASRAQVAVIVKRMLQYVGFMNK